MSTGLTYELAKKLKDAGFPQYTERAVASQEVNSHNVPQYDHRIFDLSLMGYPKEEPDYYTQGKWRSAHYFSREYIDSDECDILFFPTLSELIEACGESIQTIYKNQGEWVASVEHINTICEQEEKYEKGFGSTPEEAIANLWLTLQDNNKK